MLRQWRLWLDDSLCKQRILRWLVLARSLLSFQLLLQQHRRSAPTPPPAARAQATDESPAAHSSAGAAAPDTAPKSALNLPDKTGESRRAGQRKRGAGSPGTCTVPVAYVKIVTCVPASRVPGAYTAIPVCRHDSTRRFSPQKSEKPSRMQR